MGRGEALKKLQEETAAADLPLKETATKLVFGKGNPDADILFIGEAPGKQEDLTGKPFVGSAGKLLDEFLHGIDLCLDDVYIANILKYRPPNNRDPKTEEIITHTPYLVEQIKIIQPKVICTLGNFATKFVLAHFDTGNMTYIEGISKLHGKPKQLKVDEMEFTVIPLYHPAALLYNRSLTPKMEQDFQTVKKHAEGRGEKDASLEEF